MNGVQRTLLASIAIIAATGCAPQAAPPADTSKDVAAIKAAQDHELVVALGGNVDSAMTVFTSDVAMMPPDEPAVIGSATLRKWFEGFHKDFTAMGKYTATDVQVSGDWGVARYAGELTMTPKAKGGKPMTQVIKGIHFFKRQADGKWLIAQDVWNSDAPAPPPK